MTDKIEMWNKRSAIESMNRWFDGNNRHPLVIRGARQVGKSTLVRDFARSRGLVLHEINLYRNLDLAAALASN